jgi:MFS family permease
MSAPAPTRTSGRASGRAVLANRNFAIYFWSATISNAGSFMQGITVPFLLYQLTKSNSWVGFGSVAALIPSLIVSPLSGTLADRFSRRVVLYWANVLQLVSAIVLTICSVAGVLSPWLIIGIVGFGSAGAGFQYSAAQSIAAVLLPPEQLLQGVRLNSVGFTAARAVGPAIAGVVLELWGPTTTFTLNAVSFVVVIVGLSFVKVGEGHRPVQQRPWKTEFVEGVAYVWQRRALRLIVLTSFISAFFGQSMAQLAAGLVREDFHVAGDKIGWLAATYGCGALTSSLVLVLFGDQMRRSTMVRSGLLLFATGIAVSISTSSLTVGLFGFLVAGMAHSLTGISLNTSMQAQVAESYRGRAVTAYLMALLAGMPLGAFVGGLLGDQLGLRPTLGGFAAVIVVYVVYAQIRRNGLAVIDSNVVPDPDQARPLLDSGPVRSTS